jgi:hypothetical protein
MEIVVYACGALLVLIVIAEFAHHFKARKSK